MSEDISEEEIDEIIRLKKISDNIPATFDHYNEMRFAADAYRLRMDTYFLKLVAKLKNTQKMVKFAARFISETKEFKNKPIEDVMSWIEKESIVDAKP